jgi:hypothetical protein
MGIRELLGLPPKPAAQPAPQAQPGADPAAWDKVKGQRDTVLAHPRYAALPEAERKAFDVAWTNASALAAGRDHTQAVQILRDAVALVAKSISASASTDKVLADAAREATGMVDGARLTGVADSHLAAYTARIDQARTRAATDLQGAAADMTGIVTALKADPVLKAAKDAQGRVLSERDALDAEVARAMSVPPETATVARAQRQLQKASGMVGGLAGKLDFVGAAAQMDTCTRLVAEIDAEAGAIAANIALRDKVTAARAKIDADVLKARLVFGVDDEGEAVIEAFKDLDSAFEGAMRDREYKRASGVVAQLGLAAKRAIELGPAAEAALRAAAQLKPIAAEMRRRYQIYDATPPVTAEMERLSAKIEATVVRFDDTRNNKDYDDAIAISADLTAQFDDYDRLVAAANEVITKRDAFADEWEKTLQPRIQAAVDESPLARPVKNAVAAVQGLEKRIVAAFGAMDFDGAIALKPALVAALDTFDRLMADDAKLAADRKTAFKAYNKVKTRVAAIISAKVATPEFRAARDGVVSANTRFSELADQADPKAVEQVAELTKAVEAAEKLKPASDANADAARDAAKDKLDKIAAALTDAVALAKTHLPYSQDLYTRLREGGKTVDRLFKAGRYDEAVEQRTALDPLIAEIKAKVADWTNAGATDRAEVTRRETALTADFDTVAKFDRITPQFDALKTTLRSARSAFDKARKKDDWAVALSLLGPLEQAIAAMKAVEADYTKQKADLEWAKAARKRMKSDLKDVEDTVPNLPERLDVKARIATQKAIADKAHSEHRFAAERAALTEIEAQLVRWKALEAQDDALWTDQARAINTRYSATRANRDIAFAMTPVPKDLKPLLDRFRQAYAAFWAVFKVSDWVLAEEAIGELEQAVAAVVARKGDHDAALVVAQQKAATALAELKTLDDNALKTKPTKEKLDLLEQMRGEGRELTPEERKVQRAVYNSIDYDPDFKRVDESRRGALIEELGKDTEVMEARKGWAGKTTEQRLAVLMRVLKAECRIYGMPEPVVRLFNEPPGDEGFFSSSSGTLNLNTHPDSGFSDFKEAVDTVVHENMHNYQYFLAQRLEEGLLEPGDPEYAEAQIFAANDAPYGYVDTDEEPDPDEAEKNPYKTQPLEAHAWDTGDGVAKGLLALGEEPERGVKL